MKGTKMNEEEIISNLIRRGITPQQRLSELLASKQNAVLEEQSDE